MAHRHVPKLCSESRPFNSCRDGDSLASNEDRDISEINSCRDGDSQVSKEDRDISVSNSCREGDSHSLASKEVRDISVNPPCLKSSSIIFTVSGRLGEQHIIFRGADAKPIQFSRPLDRLKIYSVYKQLGFLL